MIGIIDSALKLLLLLALIKLDHSVYLRNFFSAQLNHYDLYHKTFKAIIVAVS